MTSRSTRPFVGVFACKARLLPVSMALCIAIGVEGQQVTYINNTGSATVNDGMLNVGLTDATTTGILDILALHRLSQGTAADNIGAAILFRNEVDDNSLDLSSRISSIARNANVATPTLHALQFDVFSDGAVANTIHLNWQGLGVGKTTPAYMLDVESAQSAPAAFRGGDNMYIPFFESGNYRGYLGSYAGATADVDFGTGGSNTTGKLHLSIMGTQKFTLDTEGDVGIGIDNPNNRLDVSKDGTEGMVTTVLGLISNTSNRPEIQFSEWAEAIPGSGMSIEYDGTGTGSGNRLYIKGVDMLPKVSVESTGDVGIGVQDPNEILEIAGDGRVFIGDGGGDNRRGLLIDAVEPGNYVRINPFDYKTNQSLDLFLATDVNIGIAEGASGYRLSVDGKIMAEEVRVQLSGTWPDYVFRPDYQLMSIPDLAASIQVYGHLPGVPSAQEVERSGQNLGDLQRSMLEKIEELTLYIIQIEERLCAVEAENARLRAQSTGDDQ